MTSYRKKNIWLNNVYNKPKSWRKKDGGAIKPRVKRCIKCKRRVVRHHHFYCDKCYKEKQNGR